MSTDALKILVRDTWNDTLAWTTLQTLLGVHREMVLKAQRDMTKMAKSVGIDLDSQVYSDIVDELNELELRFSDDLPRRGQSTSDMVWITSCVLYTYDKHLRAFHVDSASAYRSSTS